MMTLPTNDSLGGRDVSDTTPATLDTTENEHLSSNGAGGGNNNNVGSHTNSSKV